MLMVAGNAHLLPFVVSAQTPMMAGATFLPTPIRTGLNYSSEVICQRVSRSRNQRSKQVHLQDDLQKALLTLRQQKYNLN